MFDNKKVLENVKDQLNSLHKFYESASIKTDDMLEISDLENTISALRDIVYAKYNNSDSWAEKNYLTAKSAIVHETHRDRTSISKAIARGKLLQQYDSLSDALHDNLVNQNHIDLFTKIADDKYTLYLDRDIDLLVENAIKLDALHFSYLIRHWKHIVDDQLDETADEYKKFQQRYLFLNETLDGSWLIHGQLDSATGMLLNKALDDIVNKLWRCDTIEQRGVTSRPQYRADAIGYIAQGYTNASISASKHVEFNFTTPLSSDLIIDIDNINNNQTTKNFLQQQLTKTSPIHKTHSPNFLKQIFCDSQLSAPIKYSDSKIDLGRKVRIAPTNMKRQLAIESDTCSIAGCSIPASWCDAHHIRHWINGGETKIENLALLCRRHHTMIHYDKTFEAKISRHLAKTKLRSKSPQLIRTG